MPHRLLSAIILSLLALPVAAEDAVHDAREVHLTEVTQLTFGGENAEAYWSPDGEELIFQSTRPPYACDQIFRISPEAPGEVKLVSTGVGRTTCAYFWQGGERVIYASTHLGGEACPPTPDRSQGYVWPLYDSYELFSSNLDGSDLVQLTDNEYYDAEATVCPVDGSAIFTSTRDGDLDLYRMSADGGEVERLTTAPGYDGGAFFSADCSKIVWRASRPAEGEPLDDYRRLLGEGLVRPSKLELWVANADGSEARQVTYLDAASFAPYFSPSGDRILFSTNHGDPRGREFDIWAVDVDGTDLERITYSEGFDGFPMFSPDGSRLAFASNRNQGAPGETNVFVASWVNWPAETTESGADRFQADVAWLADDARTGRGIGTPGLAEAGEWLEERFHKIGLEPGYGGGYRQNFEVAVEVTSGAATALSIDGAAVDGEALRPLGFSASRHVEAEVVAAGYGITAEDLEVDDYDGVDARGKIVVVRRFTPEAEPFDQDERKRRYGDLRYKAWNAREHGAAGVLIVDLPAVEGELPEEAPMPALSIDRQGEAGIPTMIVSREVGAKLFEGGHRASLQVELNLEMEEAFNVVGKLSAGAAAPLDGSVVVGAHYDHLGMGGSGSLSPDAFEPHNGADDNASGTAALMEAARHLVARRDELARDVYVVAFSGEESGVLGSTAFTRELPEGLASDDLVAMINMDMVGRLRGNRLSVLGGESAAEWEELVPPSCDKVRIGCNLGGDGYGPSDQTPFYAAGVPVLHFFTGAHEDYHKPSDDTAAINAAGGAQIAALVADLATAISARTEPLTYLESTAPSPVGDVRSYGASLGTIPDYVGAEDGTPGVLLAGVRPGGAAEQAGMERGDILVGLAGHEIGDIHDFMFALQQTKPGDEVTAAVVRGGQRVELVVTMGSRERRTP